MNKTVQNRYNDQKFRDYMDAILYEVVGIVFNDDGWRRFVYRFSRKDLPVIEEAKSIFLLRLEEDRVYGGIDGKFRYFMKIIHNLKSNQECGYIVLGNREK